MAEQFVVTSAAFEIIFIVIVDEGSKVDQSFGKITGRPIGEGGLQQCQIVVVRRSTCDH